MTKDSKYGKVKKNIFYEVNVMKRFFVIIVTCILLITH